MLNFEVFAAGVEELKLVGLPGGPEGTEGLKAYFRHVNTIPDDVFAKLVDDAAKNLEFFPKPKWFRESSFDLHRLGRDASGVIKTLPFAEVEGVESKCPPHVRKYMQLHHDAGRQLWADLKASRAEARSRVAASGRKVSPAQWALIDESEQVKLAKAAIDAWIEKGASKGFDLHVKRWDKTEAHAEMTALAGALTPEEEIEYTFEFSVEEAITMPRFPPILEEAPNPPPIVEKISFSREPDPLVTMPGFEAGEMVECRFPDWYDATDRKESARAYPWGETGEILGFRREKSHVGNREKLYAIVEIKGERQRLTADMMMHTDTDF
jgi:hypothetical protein